MHNLRSQTIQEIKRHLNLADIAQRYVELKRKGTRLMACCPFHDEKTPSFTINEEEGFFYCFGCQASGDIFDFYGRINGLEFKDTLEQLAEEAGGNLKEKFSYSDKRCVTHSGEKRQMLHIHSLAARHFSHNLATESGSTCRKYLNDRGVSQKMIERFDLGYSLPLWQDLRDKLHRTGFSEALGINAALLGKAKSGRAYDRFRGRLMFPIKSPGGQVIAFGGRIIPTENTPADEAKYINSSDSPIYRKGEHLYGLNEARRAISKEKSIMLTEGYMDVISLHQFGYEHSVGVLGTALTPEHVKRICGLTDKVELLFDGDNAGRKAALRSCEMFLCQGLSCRVILFAEGEDIDSLLRGTNTGTGIKAFEDLRTHAPEGIDFCIQTLQGMSPREGINWARQFLKKLKLPELASRYATALATGLGLTEKSLRVQLVGDASTYINSSPLSRTWGNKTKSKQNAFGQKYWASRDLNQYNNNTWTKQNQTDLREINNTLYSGSTSENKISSDARDREILSFAVRYPEDIIRLREAGAYLCLETSWGKAMWNKIEQYAPHNIMPELDGEEKRFWVLCRSAAAPRKKDEEFSALCQMLENSRRNKKPFSAAILQNNGDDAQEKMYLRALQNSLNERKKNNE